MERKIGRQTSSFIVRGGIFAAAAIALAMAFASPAAASTPKTCTWGGTPLAATGVNKVYGHGLTSTPSPVPLHFRATGPLGGQCQGTMVFDGIMDAGASCGSITFHAKVFGLPGVVSVAGSAVTALSPAKLFDREGNVVGSENAMFLNLNDPNIVSECLSPEGVTENPFSSVIELFGTGV
jgi:hypothetical protein